MLRLGSLSRAMCIRCSRTRLSARTSVTSARIYECMCIRACASARKVHACLRLYMFGTHTHADVRLCAHGSIYESCMHVHIRVLHVCSTRVRLVVYACMHACVCVCVCVCVCASVGFDGCFASKPCKAQVMRSGNPTNGQCVSRRKGVSRMSMSYHLAEFQKQDSSH